MSDPHPMIGKWRLTAMALWDQDFVDLLGPGLIRFDADGDGAFQFGAVTGTFRCAFGPTSIFFDWQGSDDMTAVCGDGDAQLE